MKNSLTKIGIVIILAGLASTLLLMDPGDGTLTRDKGGTEVTYSLDENTLIGRSGGQKTWELEVERFTMDDKERFVNLSGQILGTIYRDGAEQYHFVATRGVYDRRTQDLEISGSLEIIADEDEQITAAGLAYEYQTNRVVLSPPIKAQFGKYTLTADQVVLEIDPELLIATGNVVICSADSEEIRCNQLYYYGNDDTWEITGVVELSTWFD